MEPVPQTSTERRASSPHIQLPDLAEASPPHLSLPSPQQARQTGTRSRRSSSNRLAPPHLQQSRQSSHSPHASMGGDNRSGGPRRRGSVLSTISSSNGLRHRRPTRTSTVISVQPTAGFADSHAVSMPGAEPGIDPQFGIDELLPEHLSTLKAACEINVIDYSEDHRIIQTATNETIADLLEEPRPDDMPCRWISVNGISWDVIRIIGNKYHLHQLAIEDLIHPRSRTKVDWYADHAAIILTLQKLVRLHQHSGSGEDDCPDCNVASDSPDVLDEKAEAQAADAKKNRTWFPWRRMQNPNVLPLYLERRPKNLEATVTAHSTTSQDSPVREIKTLHRYENVAIPEHTIWMEKHSALTAEDLAVSVEQVAIFLMSDNTVISFFEQSAEDIEIPILSRLESRYTVLRRSCDASMLLQAIIDAIVDLAGPVREAYNKARKELQIAAMTHPDIRTSRALHIFGEEIDMLQNLFKPIVHLVNALRDHNQDPLHRSQAYFEHEHDQQQREQATPKSPVARSSKRDREGTLRTSLSELKRVSYKRRNSADTSTSVAITPLAHTYFGDVLDHCITTIAALEQMDASASNISNLIFNTGMFGIVLE